MSDKPAVGFGAKSTKPSEKRDHRKTAKNVALSLRDRKYLKGLIEGKSKFKAAIEAGFSAATAKHPTANIESKAAVRAAMVEVARMAVPLEVCGRLLEQGVRATATKFATENGKITDHIECVDFKERREYMKLAAEWAEYVPSTSAAVNAQVNIAVPVRVVIEHIGSPNPPSA